MKTLIKHSILLLSIFAVLNNQPVMAQQEDIKTIEIIGIDRMKFDVEFIEVTAGEKIKIIFTTKSNFPKTAMAHNIVVLDKDADVQAFVNASVRARETDYIAPGFEKYIIAATELAGAGETVEVTFTIPSTPGEYVYLCSFPGHYGAGMRGIIKVSASNT